MVQTQPEFYTVFLKHVDRSLFHDRLGRFREKILEVLWKILFWFKTNTFVQMTDSSQLKQNNH